jgi:PAS domain S-box-containing protein
MSGTGAKPLRILAVEDCEDDVLLVVRQLQREGYAPAVARVSNASAMKEALERSHFDVVLSDFVMPELSALEALRILQASGKDIPFIVVSGSIGEDVAVQAMRAGAHDYFSKDRVDRLAAAIEREMRQARLRAERQAALEERRISDERLRLVVETMSAPVVLCSRDLRYLWVSKAYADWLGRTAEEIVGRPIVEVIGREALAAIHPRIDRVLAGEHVEYEERVTLPGLGARWIHALYTPTLGLGGAPEGWVGVLLDVDERKRSEEALRESEARFRSMANSVPAHVWMDDAQGRRLFVNSRFAEFAGLPAGQLLAEWPGLLHPDDASGYLSTYRDELARQVEHRALVRLRRHDGVYRWFEVVGLPRLEGDRFEGYTGCSFDVTGRKAAEEAAREADRRKDEFLALLGHELRNPLAPIVTALELLKHRGGVEPPVQNVIERQVHHLSRLVDDLLDLSRITRGKVTLEKRPLEIGAAVASAVETASPLLEQRKHRLEIDVPPEGLLVDGDLGRLSQVFANLLNNAARYTPPGGNLAIRARREGPRQVVVEVRDNGRGIPPEMLPHIFEMFVQAAQEGTRRQGGLGIGLSIVKSLVELHGGRVDAASEGIGRGSSFTVSLPPLARAAEPQEAPGPLPPLEKPGGRSLRVLIVDDNVDAADLIGEYLSDMGYEVECSEDGPSALAALTRFQPDVALLDIGLPVMDGYELAERIRNQLGPRSPLFIAFTGYGQDIDRERSRMAGFHAHLVKPVSPEHLIRELASIAPHDPPERASAPS